METNLAGVQVVRFGVFEVDIRTGELRKRGMRIPLQEQPLRVLSALLEEPGQIVARQELCRRLWPDDTHVDFEHSLNAAVRRLRVALGDHAGVARFIETIPRRGYRFVALNETFLHPVARGHSTGPASPAPFGRVRLRLAVIPFAIFAASPHIATNAQGDNFDNFDNFVGGLVDEAMTQLASGCPKDIRVIARASVARVAADALSAADVGRALDADFLLGGSVRRDGTRVRITAQLVASHDETHIWAATYDRVLSDAFTVQQEVAEAIAAAVVDVLATSVVDRSTSIFEAGDGDRHVG
jgi:TolB-like protein